MLNDGGVMAATGRRLADRRHVRVPARLAAHSSTTCSTTGDLDDIKKSNPEIALNADGTLDPTKYWFNIENFETRSAAGRRPASRPARSRSRLTACAGRA